MGILFSCITSFLLLCGFYLIVDWFWEVGVQEMVIYTERFLQTEARRVRSQRIPEANSNKVWDKLELLLFYSGIRNRYPFVSAKVWLLFCVLLNGCSFLAAVLFTGSLGMGCWACVSICLVLWVLLGMMRRQNLHHTERYLLELVNLTESFAVTGEEPVAILTGCAPYVRGPIGRVLRNARSASERGISSRMVLEQMKVMLEHPKWQEFIHNLSVCSMYNSEFLTVFASSRKSIQSYLSSKKERQKVRQTARMEMALIVIMCGAIVLFMGRMLEMTAWQLMWGSGFGKGCTIYMAVIVGLFFWKMSSFEKE